MSVIQEEARAAASSTHPALEADPELLAFGRSIDSQVEGEEGGQDPRPAAGQAPVPLERELAGMFAAISAAAGQFLPSVEATLDEKRCEKLGEVIAPVMRKYGLAGYLEGFAWRVELQALMVVVPIGIAVKQAIEHDLAQYRAAGAAAAGGAGLGGQDPAAQASPASSAPKAEPLKPIDPQ